MRKEIDKVLEEYVIKTWNAIANGYFHLRSRPWRDLVRMIPCSEKEKGIALDLGCGTGRHLSELVRRFSEVLAVDISKRMIEWTRKRCIKSDIYTKVHTVVANGRLLPFRYNCIDFVLSVAVLHNIPSREERLRVLESIKSTMKPRGSLLLTVWSRYQPRLLIKAILQLMRRRNGVLEFGDVLVPWRRKGTTYYRYYHLFTKKELREHITSVGFKISRLHILGRRYIVIPRNYAVLAEKVC